MVLVEEGTPEGIEGGYGDEATLAELLGYDIVFGVIGITESFLKGVEIEWYHTPFRICCFDVGLSKVREVGCAFDAFIPYFHTLFSYFEVKK